MIIRSLEQKTFVHEGTVHSSKNPLVPDVLGRSNTYYYLGYLVVHSKPGEWNQGTKGFLDDVASTTSHTQKSRLDPL